MSMLGTAITTLAGAAALTTAIVTTDQAALRATPRDSGQQQAVLRQGEMVEIRGERMDYLQVYDHQRERAGFIRASQVRRTGLSPGEAPELLTVLGFVKDTPGQEALGMGLVAAWLKAAPPAMVQGGPGMQVLDALGVMADRLAIRASSGASASKAAEAGLAGQLEVAARYGVRFTSYEMDGRMQICYEGDAFRRVLAMPAASAEQQARAALALTRPECADPQLRPLELAQLDQWRADVLGLVNLGSLPPYLKNRVQMRRAGVWSALAYARVRQAQLADATGNGSAAAAAATAISALAGVDKTELTDEDMPAYNDAAMRVNASRWAAVTPAVATSKGPSVVTTPGQPGETCVALVDARHGADHPLARRCTYGIVWTQSATLNREGNALALAVQPLPAWRELWLFRKQGEAWTISVMPPAATLPGLGYAEFAGWVPGGKQVLVAREARGEGRYQRSFMVTSIDSLVPERQSEDARQLGAFQRWQDAAWAQQSVSVR